MYNTNLTIVCVIVTLLIGTLIAVAVAKAIMKPFKKRRSDREWQEKKRYWSAEGIKL